MELTALDHIEFTFNGERRRLTRQQVLERLHDQEPEPIQTWAVDIEGRQFPVKQAFAIAAGTGRADFISTRARDLLRKLDFRVMDVKDVPSGAANVAHTNSAEAGSGDSSPELRRAALSAAINFYGSRPDTTPEEVVAAASIYERYLSGSGEQSRQA